MLVRYHHKMPFDGLTLSLTQVPDRQILSECGFHHVPTEKFPVRRLKKPSCPALVARFHLVGDSCRTGHSFLAH